MFIDKKKPFSLSSFRYAYKHKMYLDDEIYAGPDADKDIGAMFNNKDNPHLTRIDKIMRDGVGGGVAAGAGADAEKKKLN